MCVREAHYDDVMSMCRFACMCVCIYVLMYLFVSFSKGTIELRVAGFNRGDIAI